MDRETAHTSGAVHIGEPMRSVLVVFRAVPNHRHDESWTERRVRASPDTDGALSGPLAYYNNSKTYSNSNVLQVILRYHGYERVERFEDEWSIFWCAGQVEPTDLCKLRSHQKVNKFPRASALTLKANLWSCYARMCQKHGRQHYDFMPDTFVLPNQVAAYEEFLVRRPLFASLAFALLAAPSITPRASHARSPPNRTPISRCRNRTLPTLLVAILRRRAPGCTSRRAHTMCGS